MAETDSTITPAPTEPKSEPDIQQLIQEGVANALREQKFVSLSEFLSLKKSLKSNEQAPAKATEQAPANATDMRSMREMMRLESRLSDEQLALIDETVGPDASEKERLTAIRLLIAAAPKAPATPADEAQKTAPKPGNRAQASATTEEVGMPRTQAEYLKLPREKREKLIYDGFVPMSLPPK